MKAVAERRHQGRRRQQVRRHKSQSTHTNHATVGENPHGGLTELRLFPSGAARPLRFPLDPPAPLSPVDTVLHCYPCQAEGEGMHGAPAAASVSSRLLSEPARRRRGGEVSEGWDVRDTSSRESRRSRSESITSPLPACAVLGQNVPSIHASERPSPLTGPSSAIQQRSSFS